MYLITKRSDSAFDEFLNSVKEIANNLECEIEFPKSESIRKRTKTNMFEYKLIRTSIEI